MEIMEGYTLKCKKCFCADLNILKKWVGLFVISYCFGTVCDFSISQAPLAYDAPCFFALTFLNFYSLPFETYSVIGFTFYFLFIYFVKY